MKKILTIILVLCSVVSFGQMRGGAQYDPGAARKNLSNVDAQQLKLGAGTAAAPAYSFSTDPDTGIYSPGADSIGISLAGEMLFSLRSSGDCALIDGHDYNDSRLRLVSDATGRLSDNGFMLGVIGSDSYVYNYANGGMLFATNGAESMRIANSGNVLIGTSTDDGANKLQVAGEVKFAYNGWGAFKTRYAGTGANPATTTVFVGDLGNSNGDMVAVYMDIVGTRDGPGYEKFHVMIGAYNNNGTIVFVDAAPVVTSDISLGLGMSDPIITCEAAGTVVTVKMTVLDAYSRVAINTTAAGYVSGVK